MSAELTYCLESGEYFVMFDQLLVFEYVARWRGEHRLSVAAKLTAIVVQDLNCLLGQIWVWRRRN